MFNFIFILALYKLFGLCILHEFLQVENITWKFETMLFSRYHRVLEHLISSYLSPNLADRFLIFQQVIDKSAAIKLIDECERAQLNSGQVGMILFHYRLNLPIVGAHNQLRWKIAEKLYINECNAVCKRAFDHRIHFSSWEQMSPESRLQYWSLAREQGY